MEDLMPAPAIPICRIQRQKGFSALEMLIATVLILAVLGVVVKAMTDVQQRSFTETSKVDTVQQTRDFIDQVVRDIHGVGYPPGRVINGNPTCVGNTNISCGVVSWSPTAVIYEGDLDGTGTVSQIWLLLTPPPGSATCPCILERGVITPKPIALGAAPQYFTEVNGVLNSGNGAGASTFGVTLPGPGNYNVYSTADVFDAYDNVGGQVFVACTPATVPDCSQIRSLQITANVAPNFTDPVTKQFSVFSITSKARLNF
jgi:type II secretory pathway pseudopilin PulG